MGLYSSYVFPRLLDWTLGTPMIQEQRCAALQPLRGQVLEIGFGTGLNLPCYPQPVTGLTAIDSETMLRSRVANRIAKSRFPVERFNLDAGGRLPFEDDVFDGVVTTFTLCSIRDVTAALAEIKRVLKPDASYVFLEHGRSDDPQVARRQDLFNPIQKIIGCGCNLNRPIDKLITAAGLQIKKLERYLMPDSPRILAEMYRGVAHR